MMLYTFPLYNVTICDFCELLKLCMSDYNKYALQYGITKFNNDAKCLLSHCILKRCCDVALETKNSKAIFYYSMDCIKVNNDENDVLKTFIHKLIAECIKKLPLTWYCSSKPIDYYRNLIENNMGLSFLMQISNADKHKYSYDKAIKFINKYKLVFLNNNYFNCLKTRCLLLNT